MNAPIFPGSPEQILFVPVTSLKPSEDNVRKSGGQSIDELAASIRAHGLLQNLAAVAMKSFKRGAEQTVYHVVAGSRRLRAIQQLIEEGHLPADYQVPVRLVTQDEAVSASLAENLVREAMNPADQVMAFKRLHDDEGMSPSDIADSFGVSEVTVQRRLKLANCAPELLEEFRAGLITQDKMQALALTDDHERQIEIWNGCHSYDDADNIKRMVIGDGEIDSTDSIARFVGAEAYEAAGGAVRRDLFADDGQCWLTDSGLLMRLAAEKLQAEAARIDARWVDVHLSWNYDVMRHYRGCKTAYDNPTPAQAKVLKKLRAELESVSAEQDELNEEDQHDAADLLEDQRLALEAQVEALEESLEIAVGSDAHRAGTVLSIGGDGGFRVIRNQLRRAEDGKAAPADGDDDQDEDDAEPVKATAGALPRSLIERLTAHRTAATQAWLATHPHEALCVLVAQMANAMWGDGSGPLQLIFRQANPFRHGDDLRQGRAAGDLEKAEAAVTEMLPDAGEGEIEDLLDWLLEQETPRLLQILAVCTAVQADLTVDNFKGYSGSEYLLRVFNIDMADWWQPTRATFFDHVTVAQIEATVAEACDDAQVQALAKLKGKDAVAGRAEQMVAGRRWLPEVLRSGE